MNNNQSTTEFLPTKGGGYYNSISYSATERGYYWGSEAANNVARQRLFYDSTADTITVATDSRRNGFYIRCVSEEKTVLDLTYMQDMTLSISSLLPPPRL